MTSKPRVHIAVVDPAGHTPELDCFNRMVDYAPCGLHYHLPALHGLAASEKETTNSKLAGIVVLGSSTSVHDRPSWQAGLFDWIWASAEKGLPVLGLCYGHQLIAHQLGGEVVFLDPIKKPKLTGFREIALKASRFTPTPRSGLMLVSHREIVSKPPAEMEVFASSADFAFEGLMHRHLPVWTLQPHPEATAQFARNQSMALPVQADFRFGHQIITDFFKFAVHCYAP